MSCTYEKSDKTKFVGYYDQEESKIKMEGLLKDGMEIGEWSFFDEQGNQIQNGYYLNGIQIGVWKYRYPTLKSDIVWDTITNCTDFKFSLPHSFKIATEYQTDSSYTFIDNIENEVFSIYNFECLNREYVESFYKKNYDDFINQNYRIKTSSSSIIKSENILYFLDEFRVFHPQAKKDILVVMIYAVIRNNMVVLNYTSDPDKYLMVKTIIEDIFSHLYFKGERVADPFRDIQATIREMNS